MRSVKLAPTERFLVDNGLDLLEAIQARIDTTDQELLKTAAIEEQAQLLMTIPGVGVTALARKLIVLVWYMLQNGEPYRYASVESTRRKLRSLVPKHERPRALRPPRTLEEVYREADLTLPPPPSKVERRAAANNRRNRTRLTRIQTKT